MATKPQIQVLPTLSIKGIKKECVLVDSAVPGIVVYYTFSTYTT